MPGKVFKRSISLVFSRQEDMTISVITQLNQWEKHAKRGPVAWSVDVCTAIDYSLQ
jgi:hypothetical protein